MQSIRHRFVAVSQYDPQGHVLSSAHVGNSHFPVSALQCVSSPQLASLVQVDTVQMWLVAPHFEPAGQLASVVHGSGHTLLGQPGAVYCANTTSSWSFFKQTGAVAGSVNDGGSSTSAALSPVSGSELHAASPSITAQHNQAAAAARPHGIAHGTLRLPMLDN
jgi:hypothetical protein